MILVDSSVWVDYVRGTPSRHAARLHDLIGSQSVLVGDLILCEVLRGMPNETDARDIERILRAYPTASMSDIGTAAAAAANYRALRRLGVTIRGTIDLLIATFCIAHGPPCGRRRRPRRAGSPSPPRAPAR